MADSPAPSDTSELLQTGLHHILQHSTNTSYPHEHFDHDEAIQLHSNYSSPQLSQDEYMYRGHQPRYVYQHQHHDSGLGIQYDGFNPDYQSSVYNDRYSTPATSPPTPRMNNDILHTRSGLVVQRNQPLRPMPEGRTKASKSPKPKRVKKEKTKAEKKVSKLERPLSELTKTWDNSPMADIEAYVNRSAEQRQREVNEGKEPGKIKRPMNSFMLYRKAFQNRTKEWCLQNNHQVVSQVCGDSWPLESDEIREKFNEWARIERINHQNAHPGYKFSPTKPGTVKGGKRKQSDDSSSDSELSDYEWQRPSSSRRSKRSRQAAIPQMNHSVAYPTTRSAYQYSSRETTAEPALGAYNKSSYQVINPGRVVPVQYNAAELVAGEYYQQSVRQNPNIAGAQDVILTKTVSPSVHPFLRLPGAQQPQQFDLMHHYRAFDAQHTHVPKQEIDPTLMSHTQEGFHNTNHAEVSTKHVYMGDIQRQGDLKWNTSQYGGMLDPQLHDPVLSSESLEHRQGSEPIHDPHMGILRGCQDGWQVESLHDGAEFDKWLGEHE